MNKTCTSAAFSSGSEPLPTRLVLLTSSFPYGVGEPFLEAELAYLSARFDSVVLVPYKSNGGQMRRELPPNVSVFAPLRPERWFVLRMIFQGLFNRISWFPFLRELCRERFFGGRPGLLVQWLSLSLLVRMLASRSHVRALYFGKGYRQVVYSYWGTMPASIYGALGAVCPYVVRLHGVDIYAEREDNRGYIFGRPDLLSRVHFVAHVSEHGMAYLRKRYPLISYQARVCRLGVHSPGLSPIQDDGVLKILTCSRIIPLKRLELLSQALSLVSFPVHWVHIGDGPGKESLEHSVRSLGMPVRVQLLDAMSNAEVLNYYVQHPVDVFVNVSSTEGVPVTVMEALSCGVPVLATSVGGTPELVDSLVGGLLPPDLTPAFLADALCAFWSLDSSQRMRLRHAAYERWKDRADAARNYAEMAEALQGLLG